MANDSSWLEEEIPNPVQLAPTCPYCTKPGACLIPFQINLKRRMVTATYRCENGHQWVHAFRAQPKSARVH